MLFCVACVYLVVTLLSRRAIDPVVKASEKQKQFITDAGHELKTPITVIATSLKVLEMESGENKWIDKSLAQTEKLRDLVNSLVSLSRLDEDKAPLKWLNPPSVRPSAKRLSPSGIMPKRTVMSSNWRLLRRLPILATEYAIRQLVSILL